MARGKRIPTCVPGFGHLERRPGSANWYMVYRPCEGAKREVKATGTPDQQTAYDQLVELAGEYKSGRIARHGTAASATFADLFALLDADYARKNRATRDDMTARVAKHLHPVFGALRVTALRKKHLTDFIDSRLSGFPVKGKDGKEHTETLEPATVNKLLAYLRRAMQLGREADPILVHKIPEWFEKLSECNARTGTISREMYRALRDELAPHARLAFVIGYHTGLRRGAIMRLRWSWVNLRTRTITIPESEDASTKRKPRIVPIYGDMVPYLEMAHAARKSEHVVEVDGKPVESIKTAWKAACARAQVSGALFHDLRRTAATNLHEAGYDLATIMQCCGWRSPAMPMRYIQQSTRHIQSIGETMERHLAAMDSRERDATARQVPQ